MISSFQVFDLFQVMTIGGPDDQTRALSLDIYENAFRFQRWDGRPRVAVVLFLIVLIDLACAGAVAARRTGSTDGDASIDRRQPSREDAIDARLGTAAAATRPSAASRSTRCSSIFGVIAALPFFWMIFGVVQVRRGHPADPADVLAHRIRRSTNYATILNDPELPLATLLPQLAVRGGHERRDRHAVHRVRCSATSSRSTSSAGASAVLVPHRDDDDPAPGHDDSRLPDPAAARVC